MAVDNDENMEKYSFLMDVATLYKESTHVEAKSLAMQSGVNDFHLIFTFFTIRITQCLGNLIFSEKSWPYLFMKKKT